MRVLVEDLEFKCIIGVLNFEREKSQKVLMDITLHVNDEDFVDYAKVVSLTKKVYKKEKFFTLEESLLHVSEILKTKFPQIKRSKIKIIKPNILSKCRVGAEFEKKY